MSRYRNTMSELLKQVRNVKEQNKKDHEISMARGELEAIADKATQLASALQGKSDDGNPLEAWVQSKITKAKDYINSVSDYLIYNPDMKQNEEVNEKTYGWTLVSKAKDLAKKFADNMTKAVDEIEKLEKGLSKNPVVYKELLKYNEEVELDEGKMSKIDALVKQGKSSDEIAKLMNISVNTVKDILGEEKEETKEDSKKEENKESEIQSLKDQIAMLKQKLENEKNKAIKPEPNPETGEVPLTIGIAHAEFKKEKEKKEVKEDISEKAMTDREKRLQRAKDMIKYYDAQKKAALKGKNKDLAKKMLKNDTEIKEVSDKLKLKVLKKKIKQYKDKVFKKTMSTVKSPLFADKEIEEALEIKEFTSQMIDRLKKSFSTAPKKISPEQANKLSKHLDRIDLNDLRKLVKANIPFVSTVD